MYGFTLKPHSTAFFARSPERRQTHSVTVRKLCDSDARTPTCSEHDRWVASVGAACDGSDDHRAVTQRVLLPVELEGGCSVVVLRSHLEALEALLRRESEKRFQSFLCAASSDAAELMLRVSSLHL